MACGEEKEEEEPRWRLAQQERIKTLSLIV